MPATSRSTPLHAEPPGDREIDLAFLTPGGQGVAEVDERLSAFLDTAEHEVAVAIYDFHQDAERGGGRVARALQELRRRFGDTTGSLLLPDRPLELEGEGGGSSHDG